MNVSIFHERRSLDFTKSVIYVDIVMELPVAAICIHLDLRKWDINKRRIIPVENLINLLFRLA